MADEWGAYFRHSVETSVALARLKRSIGDSDVRMWGDAFQNAYVTIGLRNDSDGPSYLFLGNPIGYRPYKARIIDHPFAIRRALAKMGRRSRRAIHRARTHCAMR